MKQHVLKGPTSVFEFRVGGKGTRVGVSDIIQARKMVASPRVIAGKVVRGSWVLETFPI